MFIFVKSRHASKTEMASALQKQPCRLACSASWLCTLQIVCCHLLYLWNACLVAYGLHEHLYSVNTKGIIDIVLSTVLFLFLGWVKVFTVKSNPEESLGREWVIDSGERSQSRGSEGWGLASSRGAKSCVRSHVEAVPLEVSPITSDHHLPLEMCMSPHWKTQGLLVSFLSLSLYFLHSVHYHTSKILKICLLLPSSLSHYLLPRREETSLMIPLPLVAVPVVQIPHCHKLTLLVSCSKKIKVLILMVWTSQS